MFPKQLKWLVRAAALVALLAIAAGCAPAAGSPPSSAGTPVGTSATASGSQGAGQDASVDGAWDGTITVAGQPLGIKLNFQGQGGTIDVPAQGARGIKIENFSLHGNQIKFEMLPKPQTATFSGTVEGDKMGGAFEQAGYKGTWTASRGTAAAASPTATSDANKGYTDEEVTFKNGQVTLAGTLSLPKGSGPHPAVVLISGSGAQNRDEDVFGMKPFAILADALARQGVAVLRYDDRGVGGSSKGTAQDTSETYAGDVGAAFDYLKTRSEINPKKIGLLGHSEGGIIAPMVAVDKGDVAFLVLLAGTGVTGEQTLIDQVGAISKASGDDQATTDQKMAEEKRVLDAVLSGDGIDKIQAEMVAQFKAAAEKMPESQRQQLGDIDKWAQQNVQAQLTALQSPWMKFFLTHDPAPVLEKVHAPVLALFGGKDTQVVASVNELAIKSALEKGGNKDVTTKIFPDANHLFQAAQTGSPAEYTTLKPEFGPGVVDTITGWVVARTK